MTPVFGPNIVHCISLSKAGLPGERVGIAIGDEKIIQILEAFQTNLCIHSSRYGQAIAARAIRSGALADIAKKCDSSSLPQQVCRARRNPHSAHAQRSTVAAA